MATPPFSKETQGAICDLVDTTCKKPVAEHAAFVVTLFLFVFGLWGALALYDYINDRWSVVSHVAWHGYIQIAIMFPTSGAVIVYMYYQGRAMDYPEMCAALVALGFSLFHFARTSWGLMQLCVLKGWINNVFHCLDRLGYRADSQECMSYLSNRALRWVKISDQRQEKIKEGIIDRLIDQMIINSSMIDNEFFDADVPVIPNKEFILYVNQPMLRPKKPEDCYIRWVVPFLCQFGRAWLQTSRATSSLFLGDRTPKTKEEFLTRLCIQANLIGNRDEIHDLESVKRNSLWARILLCQEEATSVALDEADNMPFGYNLGLFSGGLNHLGLERYEFKICRISESLPIEKLEGQDDVPIPEDQFDLGLVHGICSTDLENLAVFLHPLSVANNKETFVIQRHRENMCRSSRNGRRTLRIDHFFERCKGIGACDCMKEGLSKLVSLVLIVARGLVKLGTLLFAKCRRSGNTECERNLFQTPAQGVRDGTAVVSLDDIGGLAQGVSSGTLRSFRSMRGTPSLTIRWWDQGWSQNQEKEKRDSLLWEQLGLNHYSRESIFKTLNREVSYGGDIFERVYELATHIDNIVAIVSGLHFQNFVVTESYDTGLESNLSGVLERSHLTDRRTILKRCNRYIQGIIYDWKGVYIPNERRALQYLGTVSFMGCIWSRASGFFGSRTFDKFLPLKGVSKSFSCSEVLEDTAVLFFNRNPAFEPENNFSGYADSYALRARILWECQSFCHDELTRLQERTGKSKDDEEDTYFYLIASLILGFPSVSTTLSTKATILESTLTETHGSYRCELGLGVEAICGPQDVSVMIMIELPPCQVRSYEGASGNRGPHDSTVTMEIKMRSDTSFGSGVLDIQEAESSGAEGNTAPTFKVDFKQTERAGLYGDRNENHKEPAFKFEDWKTAFDGRMEAIQERREAIMKKSP